MHIFPAIDLRDGKCVRLIQGDYQRQIDYADNPVTVAGQFAEDGATWLHVVDLDGAKTGQLQNLSTIQRIAEPSALNIQVGGGIRDVESVDALLAAGASRVVIGTRALEDWAWFEDLVRQPNHADKIVLGLDARQGQLATHGWQEQTTRSAVDVAEAVSEPAFGGLAAIVYTDISRDGMLLGPNLEAIRALVGVSGVPVIASGGVTDLNDVRTLAGMPLAGIIIGRALYEGTIALTDAVKIAEGQ